MTVFSTLFLLLVSKFYKGIEELRLTFTSIMVFPGAIDCLAVPISSPSGGYSAQLTRAQSILVLKCVQLTTDYICINRLTTSNTCPMHIT